MGITVDNQKKPSTPGWGLVPPPKTSGCRTQLRLWKLANETEEAALGRLCSGLRNKRGFRSVVLAHLQLIADTVSFAAKEKDIKPRHTKPSAMRRALERRAQRVRVFARKMEKPLSTKTGGLGLLLPLPPIRELQLYADDLEACAKRLKRETRFGPPRNRPRPETPEIIKLVEFVKGITEKRFLEPLAVLLRRPTGVTYNEASLKELVRFWQRKRASRRVHFPSIRGLRTHSSNPRSGFPQTL